VIKQNRSVTIRLPKELLEKLMKDYNPEGFFSLSQTIRMALVGYEPVILKKKEKNND
jgi:hypothetical protein|tara:strand:- start:589 stop:759 length:171 start_codon:yes stop_codon:yes gene_type:complete